MDIEFFNYDLPAKAIAQEPLAKRDDSRLMVLHRQSGKIEHRMFYELPEFLNSDDILVLNDSQVIPARLYGQKQSSETSIELMLAQPLIQAQEAGQVADYNVSSEDWLALARPGRRLVVGDTVEFGVQLNAEILEKHADGTVTVRLKSPVGILDAIQQVGVTPLPPYIRRPAELADANRYQTVYAAEPGSVAAPTAGLHFTPELIQACKDSGVQLAYVTLHVGVDTFRPVHVDSIDDHKMHSEWYHISTETAELLSKAKAAGRRIVCVGTTSVRTLEGAAQASKEQAGSVNQQNGVEIKAGWASTEIFIYPGYHFNLVDALVTNFHLPKSTLLMLVSAFYSREAILKAYQEALDKNYRFFSYGDAMLII